MRPIATLLTVPLLSVVTLAQPAFELADVHASARTSNPTVVGGMQRGGRYELRRATMVDLIRTAYGVDPENVIGGPSWLESDRFDVIAKAAPGTSAEAMQRMLQTLLADRFGLVIHTDTKPLQAFVLSLAKGKPKLKEADESNAEPPGCRPQPFTPVPGKIPNIVMVCHNMTMPAFAATIHERAGGYLTSPVVDSTGLKGGWDFTITWTARGAAALNGEDGITIFDAVEKLGLKLELQKIPSPVIVVDRVNQKPTPNAPGVSTALPPPPPTEFEVADIKPSLPGAPQRGSGLMPGGRINLRGATLRNLVTLAWEIPPNEEIPGAPKFLESARFDLIAKAATTGGPNQGPGIEIDDLRMMLRGLLADRFQLKTHYEDRPVTAYTLVATKPKLKKADPVNRTGCKTGPAPVDRDAQPGIPPMLATCQNMTMAQFAEQLQHLAPVYIHYPAEDGTQLEGAFDFALTFSPIPADQLGGGGGRNGGPGADAIRPADGNAAPTASEPSSALSLFDALNRQLGLKLEAHKRPMPVLVIDHIEEKPTDN